MIHNATHDKALLVYGKGLNVRDWLYVKDHCYGILAVIEKGRIGEVYNLGGHNEKTNIEIVKIILDKLGKQESLIIYVADRHGHDQRYAIDPAKAMAELGWAPTTMFKDGIVLLPLTGTCRRKVESGLKSVLLVSTPSGLRKIIRREDKHEIFRNRRQWSVGP
jgi:dTDP-D-glucose 4,6-dehydratase